MAKSKIVKHGGSFYLKVDPYYRTRVNVGDWVEYDIRSIEPSVTDSVGTGSLKTDLMGTGTLFSRSCLYGLLNAPFDSVFFPINNKYSGGFALQAV